MKAFIFEYVKNLTDSFHCGGGLIVLANDIHHLQQIISTDENIRLTQAEYEKVIVYDVSGFPDARYFIFPDAGCC